MDAPNVTLGRQAPRTSAALGAPSDALGGAGTAGTANYSDVGLSAAPGAAARVAAAGTGAAGRPGGAPAGAPAGNGGGGAPEGGGGRPPAPAVGTGGGRGPPHVTERLRAWFMGHDMLKLAPPWTAWPDYDQVRGRSVFSV